MVLRYSGLRTTQRACHQSDSWALCPASRSQQSLKACVSLTSSQVLATWGSPRGGGALRGGRAGWSAVSWGWVGWEEMRLGEAGSGPRISASTGVWYHVDLSHAKFSWFSLKWFLFLHGYNVFSFWGLSDSVWHSPLNVCETNLVEFGNNSLCIDFLPTFDRWDRLLTLQSTDVLPWLRLRKYET